MSDTTSSGSSPASNLNFTSPGLILNGQNVGGGISFNYAVPIAQDVNQMITNAAGLTQNAFATDQGFFNGAMTSQENQQKIISQNTLSQLSLIAATTQNANNQAAADTRATLNATGGSMSFITTATCEALFDKTEAWEKIRKLEKWRDDILLKDEKTKKLVKRYECVAPAIVRRVNAKKDALKIWKRTYKFFITPIIYELDKYGTCDYDKVLLTYKQCVHYLKTRIKK